MKPLDLKQFFKSISNQARLEILILILDNVLTATEIAEKLEMDVSTVYRHLKYLKNVGILKSKRINGVELFDFTSPKVFNVIENATEFVSEINGVRILDCKDGKKCLFDPSYQEHSPSKILDMRGEICPVPDIQTRKILSEMEKDEILLVIVDYPLSAERIPISIKRNGSKVLAIISDYPGEVKIYIKK